MKIKKAYAVYFSATGTTERAATAIAEGTGWHYEQIDLTLPQARQKGNYSFARNELAIVGLPVYGGRLPKNLEDFFSSIRGDGTPAMALVVYGNREYNDALIELKIRLEGRGFNVIAGATFIGEHTFSKKIATGRPNLDDLVLAKEFGRKIAGFLTGNKQGVLRVPGSYPFQWQGFDPTEKPVPGRPVHPSVSTNEACISCGICAENCPWGAIDTEDYTSIDNTKCMRCFRCIKNCPVSAKEVVDPKFYEFLKEFEKRLNAVRKEPEIFLAE
jgi:ferredoxin